MESTSQLVWLYVKQRPFLREFLRQDIVNYSALARKIAREGLGDRKKENAVKMALIRLGRRMAEADESLEGRIVAVLKKSSMTVKNKVAVITAMREIEGVKYLSSVRSGRHMTYIVEQRELEALPPGRGLWKMEDNLNLVIIESPEDVESVPGVISFLLSTLAAEGINVVEFISCYTDTLLVVRQADTQKAFRLLSDIMG